MSKMNFEREINDLKIRMELIETENLLLKKYIEVLKNAFIRNHMSLFEEG